MRCANCGFPLSPSRTSCPRCGASITEARGPQQPRGVPEPVSMQQNSFGGRTGGTDAPPSGANYAPATPWQGSGMNFPQPATPQPAHQSASYEMQEQWPFPSTALPNSTDNNTTTQPAEAQAGPGGFAWPPAAPMDTPMQAPTQSPGRTQISQPGWPPPAPPGGWGAPQPAPQSFAPPTTNKQANKPSTIRFNRRSGFTLATLCLSIGALLLIFVQFMAGGLATSNAQAGQTAHNAQATKGTISIPTPAPTVAPTAVPLPGQQYIDNAQTATGNTPYSLPAQVTSTFKVGQPIYVTFTIHPAGQSGYVCVYWYQNNQQFFKFAFGSSPLGGPSYSFTPGSRVTAPGPGYVELYWSWTPDCLSKVMAQHVEFTVSG